MGLDLYVFDSSITPLGVIDVVTGLTWLEKFSDAGNFELWCPLNDQNAELLKEDNLLWIGGESAGVVEFKELTNDGEGTKTIHIQGRLAESYLDYRTIYPTVIMTGKISDILRKHVNDNLISPTDITRKIPLIELASDQVAYGQSVSYQKTGDTVLLESSKLCEANSLGFRLQFFPRQTKFVFRVYQGTDRTLDQSEVNPVLFSSDLDDILESSYSHNKSELRNFAYVAGEDSGTSRKIQTVGSTTGLSRRELFVDARDLQSEKTDGIAIPETEYNSMLVERGKTSLEDYKDIESFSATLRTFGVTGYVYGVDFFLGDKVTVYDGRLKVRTNAVITGVMKTFDGDGERLDITFGYEQPTLANKLKRRT
jgi:hypothetical protein